MIIISYRGGEGHAKGHFHRPCLKLGYFLHMYNYYVHPHTRSCGNQMFSLHSDGVLRWQSSKFGNSTLGSITPPSVHPDGHAYFIHQNGTVAYRLATKDGTLDKMYNIPRLGYFEPPIIVGSKFMYLIGFAGNAVTIVPVEL